MKFSILVPVYNVEQYLEQCLESLLNQTYSNYEVILVDDGSTDKSGQICDWFVERAPNIFQVIHKKNEGLISARRVGIQHAESDYCVFVDSDDFVEENLLEVIARYLYDETVDVLVYSYRYYVNEKKGKRFHVVAEDGFSWEGESKKDVYERFSCTSDFTSIWTKAIRTSILKEDPTDYIKNYEKNMSEDIWQSIYPLTVAKKIVYTDRVLYNYRINEASISRSFYPETIEKKNSLHVYNELLSYLPKWGLDCEEIRDRLKARWFNDFMYMMSKYYENAQNSKEREAVLAFDWDLLLPKNAYDINNIYENNAYKELYVWLKQGNKNAIWWYFFKKKCYQSLRQWKKRIWKIKK